MQSTRMASVSISSSPACSMKLQQQHQLSSSSLLSSPNTSSSSTTLSPTSSLHSHHTQTQLQLAAQIQQHIAQQQQQQSQHRLSGSNSLSNSAAQSLSIKKEPGLISPPGIGSAYVNVNNNSGIKNTNTMLMNANVNVNNNNSPISSLNNVHANSNMNANVNSSGTAADSTSNVHNIFCGNNNIISTSTPGGGGSKCKRKINFSHLGIPNRGHQPATVARRNARERNRVKQVNNGFAALKQHIPLGHRSKKMSKVETLRCAVDYIKNLKTLLDPNGVFTSDEGSSAFDQLLDFGLGSASGGSTQQHSPTSSEDPSSPSYASEGSYVASSGGQAGHGHGHGDGGSNANGGLYDYENYEPVSPEDEELLDAISWWQQS